MNADEADAEEFDDGAESNDMKMDVDDIDNDSDADPVVQEIPVYLALGLDGLVLMQHPSSRKNHPLSTAVAMRCKPVAHRFEVEVPISVHSDNYNIDMGERLGLGLDNEDILTAYDKRNPFREEKRKLLEKQTLQSSLLPVSSGGQYLIGALRDDEFHLTPISATIQLRPALRYLDKILEKERVANAKIQQHELNLEQGVNADKKSAADMVEKGVNVSVRNVEDNPEALRKAKDLDEEKRFALEEWVDLKLYDEDAPESQETYERLFSLGDELTYSFSKQDYLESVGPKLSTSAKSAIESGKSNIKPNWSFDDIMNLPLPSLLTSLLVHVQVIAFSQIVELTDNQFDESDILDELERIAVLVRGVWVIRSEHMYSGRVADARRYLLYILARTGSKPVSRYEINKIAKLPHTVITNLFIDICARNPLVTEAHTGHVSSGTAADPVSWVVGRGIATAPAMWGLKSEPDAEFCANYPAVVKRQTDIVISEGERAKQALETKSGSKIQHASIKNESSNASASSSRAMPATAAASFSRPSAASNGAASASGIGASSSGAPAAAPAKQSARATSNNNSNASITKFPLSGATMEEQAENLLFFIFQKFGVCSEEFVVSTTMMHKDGHEGTAENLLDADEVNESFVKELLNTFCIKVQDRYVLKSLNGPIDEFRTPVVTLFMTKNTVRKVDITAACQTATGKNVPQSMYIKIMKELAVSSGPTWEFKKSPE
ncbi:Sin-like protein conserved region-domain-containing protein [Chytriomyces cf. hyalinus JEL632]|nr:Sin-like protein conserved region-domain-containing protein [Chytriomyces cf. hyalinus JEL632]